LEISLETLVLATGSAVNIAPTTAVGGMSRTARHVPHSGPNAKAVVAIGAGMLAGFAAGAVAGKTSKDANTAAAVGLGVGVATGIATAIMMRNRDFEVPEGTTLDVRFDHPVRLD
jgi:molecular chaperone DnaK (HSP70)